VKIAVEKVAIATMLDSIEADDRVEKPLPHDGDSSTRLSGERHRETADVTPDVTLCSAANTRRCQYQLRQAAFFGVY